MGKKKKNKEYFTLEVDAAIIKYNESYNRYEKEKIYNSVIYPAFDKLCENLINTYKCPYIGLEFEELKHDLISFLTEKLPNFSQSAGKAYSYYTVSGRNYLIALNNKNYSKLKKYVDLDVVDEERDIMNEVSDSNYKEILHNFMEQWIATMDNRIYDIFSNKDDISIADSIIELFKIRVSIDNFNKKALYHLIKERTNLKTQRITRVINILKSDFEKSSKQYFRNS